MQQVPDHTPDRLWMCLVQPNLKDRIKGRPSVWMPDLRRHTQLCLLQGLGYVVISRCPGECQMGYRNWLFNHLRLWAF